MAPPDVSTRYKTLVHMHEPSLIFVHGPRMYKAIAGTRKRERDQRLEHMGNQLRGKLAEKLESREQGKQDQKGRIQLI